MSWWFLSFADKNRSLGVTAVKANDPKDAVIVARNLGRNPGGEVQMLELDNEEAKEPFVEWAKGGLRTDNAEIEAHGAVRGGDLPEEVKEEYDERAVFICEDCNNKVARSH